MPTTIEEPADARSPTPLGLLGVGVLFIGIMLSFIWVLAHDRDSEAHETCVAKFAVARDHADTMLVAAQDGWCAREIAPHA